MMPPKKRLNNWILWWVIVVPTVFVVAKRMIEPTITLGEVIALCIAVPAAIYGVWKAISYILYRTYPFVMKYQESLPFDDVRLLSGKKTLQIGESKILLRVQPKRETIYDRVHIRFVNKKHPASKWPSRNQIGIDIIQYVAEGLSPDYHLEDDYTNGQQTRFHHPYRCTPEGSLYLYVTITANALWNGYIMFQAPRTDGHLGYSYLPLEVTNND